MNRYKKTVTFFKVLLSLMMLAVLAGLLIPIARFHLKPAEERALLLDLSDDAKGLTWYLGHKKIETSPTQKNAWIYTDNAAHFNEEWLASIEDNVFVGEMLFAQFEENEEKTRRLERILDAEYLGFVGRTISDLSDPDEVSSNLSDRYERTTGKVWNFYGAGIVLENAQEIIVLLEGKDYEKGITLQSGGQDYPFQGSFELVRAKRKSLATFQLPLTPSGEAKLAPLDIGSEFDAFLSISNRLYTSHYFAGSFSRIDVKVPAQYEGMTALMQHKGLYDESKSESLYWKWYVPTLDEILHLEHDASPFLANAPNDVNLFFVEGQTIYLKSPSGDQPFFMKGVNLGAALPGKTFTEFPQAESTYMEWLQQMETLHINTIRVYTLLPPAFYDALYAFNQGRENPIYLLQEIWPEEEPENHDYLMEAYNAAYRKEIENTVHAIHGNINIPKRPYRSYGLYKADVSAYLIGYLVGRELEPEEVKATDRLNQGYAYQGDYLFSQPNASPTEAWLASGCDYALRVEDEFYSDSPLVAIVSWPTLDPMEHDSEWHESGDKDKLYNDSAVVDINRIGINPATVSGFFGAYHIYPNYPDFMNNEPSYDDYQDTEGSFRYGGYLKEFIAGHKKYPALVAEYGLSTSQVTAHYSPDGYHHGGLSEEEQAEGIVRMTKAIVSEGYSGAIIFEWMDEWAKKTWTTEPYMIPYEKNPFWHNTLDPEQNYGLMAVEAAEFTYESSGPVTLGQNEAYLLLEFDASNMPSSEEGFAVAIDTIPSEPAIPEFILTFGPDSKIQANPGYQWLQGHYASVEAPYHEYVDLIQITNQESRSRQGLITDQKTVNLSLLGHGDFSDPGNNVNFEQGRWRVRLPYGIIGISDPSKNRALYDQEPKIPIHRDEINTLPIDSLTLTLLPTGETYAFDLRTWEQPRYAFRMKNGFSTVADFFDSIR